MKTVRYLPKKFFALGVDGSRSRTKDGSLHVLYLGRRHPLKGVEFLERADEEIRKKEKGEGRKCGVTAIGTGI